MLAAYESHSAEALAAQPLTVSVAGRLMVKRVMGGTSFVKLQDRSGQIQLMLKRDRLGESPYGEFKKWDVGDIVAARGELIKTKTGELSIDAAELRLLAKSLRPLPEKWHGITDAEMKLRQRYVDLIMSEETREVFRRRSVLIRFIRSFLDTLDFTEVETPMMQPIPGGAAARPFVTHHNALDATLYLRIAPELYLKRLLVGGFERVYELNRVFRNEGLSTRHNPEFTMLELYQAYAGPRDLMTLTENLLRGAAVALTGGTDGRISGRQFRSRAAVRGDHGRGCARASESRAHRGRVRDRAALVEVFDAHGIEAAPELGIGKLQYELFERTVESTLRGPVFVTQYPAEVSPLARCNDQDPFVTDRFELFIGGRELANGFAELNDPEEQAARFQAQAEAKASGDPEAMFFDADYVRALEYGMPPAAGLGIGVDRLAMLLTNSPSIRDVLLFPQLKPET